ncbi:MAG: HDOD domain-containing protein [Anaeromyxobacter sp.]|nr:HDOD domain-containing protein [Anaeromyxobacter sp.]MBL0278660.1 HDOD domain-containing protein [Anaeromyxobacter sp.]
MRIERLVGGGDFGLDELARLVASDQVLAADVLRCANSAAFSRGEPVAAVPQAVARIGAGELSRIAFASALGARALARGPLALLRRRTWHDAVAAAVLARELARARGLPLDESFAAGLLHDFGKVLAIECLERIAAGARQPRQMPAAFWELVVEHHHVRLGAVLAAHWALPPLLAEAITLHHQADLTGASHPGLVAAVALCDRMVRLLDERSAVGLEDVGAVQALSEADTDALIRGIEVVPGFVAAFEREPAPPDRALLAPAPAPVGAAPRRPVRLRVGQEDYAVTGFARHQLVVQGRRALPEGALLEVELQEAEVVRFHARVLHCWEEGPRFGAVLMPFALGGPALLRWQGLTAIAEG